MRRFLPIFFFFLGTLSVFAQYTYDFGTGTNSYNTASGSSTTFFTGTPTNGGTYRVRAASSGNQGAGFTLANPGTTLGTGTELQINASVTTSTNKFAVYDWTGVSTVAYAKFKVRSTSTGNGTFNFSLGINTLGSDNNGYTNQYNNSLASFTFTYASGSLSTVVRRVSGSNTTVTGSGLSKDSSQTVEVYGNNGSGSVSYLRNGTSYSLATKTWDLWVDGVRVVTNAATAGTLAASTNLSGFGIFAESSTSNAANIYIDDLEYSGTLPSALTPPTLTAAGSATVDGAFNVTFTDDATWRGAITGVTVAGVALTAGYSVTAGNITFTPSASVPDTLLRKTGTKTISVTATGYSAATVSQTINPGAVSGSNSTTSISSALALNTTRTVTLTAKDQYGNTVPGYVFKYGAVVTNNNASTAESYTVNGAAVTSNVNNQSLTATNGSGVATYDITIPAVVDGNDGISVTSYMNNGTTAVGGANTFTAPTSPSVSTSTGTITAFSSTQIGANSAEQTYNVSGASLSADITVTAPTGFQVSLTSGSGFGSSVTLIRSGNSVASTPVYVRFAPGTIAAFSDSISHTSASATTQYVKVSGTGIGNNASDVILDPAFTHPTSIAYNNYQDTTLTSSALTVGQFIIRDGGASASDADAAATTLTAITFSLTNSSMLRRVAIFDGTTNVAQLTAGATLTFTGLSLAASDNGTKIFTVKASFASTVTDKTQFQLTVTSATASSAGSTFTTANAGGAATSVTGSNNTIEVVATKLKFVTQPVNTEKNVAMSVSPSVEATDVLNNRDIDRTGTVFFSSTGTMTGTPTATLVSGLGAATSSIIHTVTGSTVYLKARQTGLDTATSSAFNIYGGLTELVVPQYFGAKNAASSNTQRTPVSLCLSIDGLTANTTYNAKVLLELSTTSGSTGAGVLWNSATPGWNSSQYETAAFTTDASGNSGPFWVHFEASGNGTRFAPGQVHTLRASVSTTTTFSGTTWTGIKTLTALDINSSAYTADSTDDGAFFKGSIDSTMSGKYVLLFDNVAGTGNPLFATQIRTTTFTNTTQTTLPTDIDSIWMNLGTKGRFAGVIPAQYTTGSGVRRVEIRNANNTVFAFDTSSSGIWNSTNNTITAARRSVINYKWTYRLGLTAGLQGIGFGGYADTVTVELRDTTSSLNLVKSKQAIVTSRNGSFGFEDLTNYKGYYIVVKHRNTIETWSANPIRFGGNASYNFTTAADKAYGSNQLLNDGIYFLYSGDVNQDGLVDLSDLLAIDNDNANFVTGYFVTDLNGDEVIDLSDLLIADNNNAAFVGRIVPSLRQNAKPRIERKEQ